MTKKQIKQRQAELKKEIAAVKKDIKKDIKAYGASAKKVVVTAKDCGVAQNKFAEKASAKNSKKLTLAQTKIATEYKDYAAIGGNIAANIATVDANYAELASYSRGKKAAKIAAEATAYVTEWNASVADVQAEVAKTVAVKGADGTIQQPATYTRAAVAPTRELAEVEASLKAAKKAMKGYLALYQGCEDDVIAAAEAYKKAQAKGKKLVNAQTNLSVEYKEYATLKNTVAATLATIQADYADIIAYAKEKKAAKLAVEAETYIAECKTIINGVDTAIASAVVVKNA